MTDVRNIEDVAAEHLEGLSLPIPARGAILTALRELRVLRQSAGAPREPESLTARTFAPAFALVLRVLEFGAEKHGDAWAGRECAEDLKHALDHIVADTNALEYFDIETGLPNMAHAIARLVLILQRGINQSS